MLAGVLALTLLTAASCQPPAASAVAFTDATSLLQRGLSLEAGQPSLQRAPLLQQDSQRLSLEAGQPSLHTAPLLQQDSARTGSSARAISSASINLDLPPEERWYAAFGDRLKTLAVDLMMPLDRTLIDDIDWTPDEEFVAEMRGIVKAVNSPNLTLDHLLARELGYEKGFTACTGVLAATSNGTVFHGRNLDLAPSDRDSYESAITDVTFYRAGKPLFSATSLRIGPGFATGYRIGSYSAAQNTRPGCGDLDLNLEGARRGSRPFALLLRRVLQDVDNYEEAVHRLAEAPLIAPMYFHVAGAGAWEGALVTRDRYGHSAPYPNVETLDPQINRWFIVQTNDDTWEPARDDRRPTALAKFSSMAPTSINAETMLEVMTTEPVLNNGTIFTWILQPATGLRRVFLGSDELGGDVAVPAVVSNIRVTPPPPPPR